MFKVGDLVRRRIDYQTDFPEQKCVVKGDLGIIVDIRKEMIVVRYFKGPILNTNCSVSYNLELVKDKNEHVPSSANDNS